MQTLASCVSSFVADVLISGSNAIWFMIAFDLLLAFIDSHLHLRPAAKWIMGNV